MRKKGFTLIELLVVIAIIGILATIVVLVTRQARDAAKDARIQTQLHQVSTFAELFYSQNNGYDDGAVGGDHVCTMADVATLLADIDVQNGAAATPICESVNGIDPDKYCCSAVLNDGTTLCVSDAGEMVSGAVCVPATQTCT